MGERTAPEWMHPENLRWAAYQWENKVHFRRMGGVHSVVFANSESLDRYFDRLFCLETLQQFRALGITAIATNFYKGYGLEAEAEEIARQIEVVKLAHQAGLRVIGYINSNACYYETLFKELPGVKERLQRDVNGRWRRPEVEYYPHKALLCCSYPEYLEYMKLLADRCFEIGFDGIHYDMAKQGSCFCPECTRQFRDYLTRNVKTKERLGFLGFEYVEIPATPATSPKMKSWGHIEAVCEPLQQEYLKFNIERFAKVRRDLFEYLKTKYPDKGIILNNSCTQPRTGGDPELLRDVGDAFFIESNFSCQTEDGGIATSIFSYKRIEAMGKIAIPTQWLNKDGVISLPETPRQIDIGVLESAVYGGVPGNTWSARLISGDKLHVDIRELSDEYTRIIRFLDDHRELFAGAHSLPQITLLISHDSYRYEEARQKILHIGLEAICHTLQRANIPFAVKLEADFDPEDTTTQLVILSESLVLSDTLVSKLHAFVRRGGKFLCSGRSGDFNQYALRKMQNSFADLEGNPNFCRLSPAPEMTIDANAIEESKLWGSHIVNCPTEYRKILDAIEELNGANLPFRAETSSELFVEARRNHAGRMILHILNFGRDTAEFKITLPYAFTGKIHRFDESDPIEISGNIVSGSVKCYAVLEM